MATPFDVIHTRAIAKLTDYDILKLEPSMREQVLNEYLRSAQVEFQRLCKEDLSDRDDNLAQMYEYTYRTADIAGLKV